MYTVIILLYNRIITGWKYPKKEILNFVNIITDTHLEVYLCLLCKILHLGLKYPEQKAWNSNVTCYCTVMSSKRYSDDASVGTPRRLFISDAVSAEILLRSPRKIFISIIKKYVYRIKVSKNQIIQFWKNFTGVNDIKQRNKVFAEPQHPRKLNL